MDVTPKHPMQLTRASASVTVCSTERRAGPVTWGEGNVQLFAHTRCRGVGGPREELTNAVDGAGVHGSTST